LAVDVGDEKKSYDKIFECDESETRGPAGR
jgi:hypothetical protein